MSKLRKALPKSYASIIFPSDEAIDYKKTAIKLSEDVEYMTWLKEQIKSDMSIEDLKKDYLQNVQRGSIYSAYVRAKFNPDIIVPKEGLKVLNYVFEDFNVTDAEKFEEIEKSLKDQTQTTKLSLDLLKQIFTFKLKAVVGVDEGISREEIISETIKNLHPKDIEVFNTFIQKCIELDVEKKSYSQSW